MGSILRMVEVPYDANDGLGGDTSFADSHCAYLGLPAKLQARLQRTSAVHDYRVFLHGVAEGSVADLKADIPFGVTHPLVRTHPETGKSALMLHHGFMRHGSFRDTVTGEPWGEEDSVEMMKELRLAHGTNPEYQCRFRWEPGSVAFWDNRACQHSATGDFFPNVRIGHRVTIGAATRPYFDPEAAARERVGGYDVSSYSYEQSAAGERARL